MSQLVKVKVRPGRSLAFPGICVHCSRPAAEQMALKKRSGRVTRLIDVPICTDCYREIRRQSGEEERFQRLGRVAALATAILALAILFVLLPGGIPLLLRLLAGLTFGLILSALVFGYFRRKGREAALPEKKAILDSACINAFSWRATIFEFDNEAFAERFIELNEPKLMEL